MSSYSQLGVIIWVQLKSMRNAFSRAEKGGTLLTLLVSLLWYGMFTLGAVGLSFGLAKAPPDRVSAFASVVLLIMTGIWQVFPIMLGSSGAHIDIRRLLVYPIPTGQLFSLEVALRITTALEMAILLAGMIAGVTFNRNIGWWAPVALLLFGAFNLLLSTAIKQVLARLAGRKYMGELAFLLFIMLLLIPQLLASGQDTQWAVKYIEKMKPVMAVLPWGATGKLALGNSDPKSWLILLAWVGLTYRFARMQFERLLQMDESGERKKSSATQRVAASTGLLEQFYRIPGRLFADPLAAIIEKELRFLSRAPRFRLLLLLASTMGTLLWMPQVLRAKDQAGSFLANNYLTFTCMYSMLILAENLFVNSFGFDRAAAQNWFVLPVDFRTVLRAKNMVAFVFLGFCFCLTAAIGFLLPVSHSLLKFAEAASVCSVYIIFMLSIGNIGSVYQPKPVDPQQSWRSNSPSRVQALMMLVYPVMYLPIALAYAARWATEMEWTFFVVLGIDAILACGFYYVAMESAVEMADERREKIISLLSAQSGPISITS